MELNMKADYSVLYDGAPQMKAVSVDKKKLDEKAKKVFLANIIKSKKLSEELLLLLKQCYEHHADRNIGDAIVIVSQTIQSINKFKNSLQ